MKIRTGFDSFMIPRKFLETLEYDRLGDVDLLQCGEEAECYLFPTEDELTQACFSDDDTDPGDHPEFVMLFKE